MCLNGRLDVLYSVGEQSGRSTRLIDRQYRVRTARYEYLLQRFGRTAKEGFARAIVERDQRRIAVCAKQEVFTRSLQKLEILLQGSDITAPVVACEYLIALYKTLSQKEYEEASREVGRREGWTMLNEVLFYKPVADRAELHLVELDCCFPVIKRLVLQGLRGLANCLQHDNQIQQIIARSWVTSRCRRYLCKLGFESFWLMGEDEQAKRYPLEHRQVTIATMSKQRLLELYQAYSEVTK